MRHGVGILMCRLDGVRLTDDGKTAIAGGGIVSRKFLGDLWEMGKMTGDYYPLPPKTADADG